MAATANIFESNDALRARGGAAGGGQEEESGTERAHRKVELQSPADLAYLLANVQRAARQKIDTHFPPEAAPEGGEDAMRRRVEELVDEYIRNTFDSAKHSMSINGMDSRELDAELAKAQEGEEIEPFDSKLAQRMQALSSQIERHTLDLANLRRTAPAESSRKFQESFTQHSQLDDARLQRDETDRLAAAKDTEMKIGETERMEEVQSTWQSGAQSLLALKTGLGGTVEKMERAQRVVDVLEGR